MSDIKKRLSALLASVLLASSLGLAACGGSATTTADSSEGTEATEATEATETQTGELYGKPWVTSFEVGNLPAEAPEAKDDLYTSVNYDYIKAHQTADMSQGGVSAITDHAGEYQTDVIAIIKDETKTSHDLEQVRILFNQAKDWDTLKQTGLSEVQPYLDMIANAKTIDELNAVLASPDFPFSPFVNATVASIDTQDKNIVAINPNFLMADGLLTGGQLYQETGNEEQDLAVQQMLYMSSSLKFANLMLTGMDMTEMQEAIPTVFSFEKTYGMHADYAGKYLKQEYGAYADTIEKSVFTLDELCALCPHIPMKEILTNCGKASSPSYLVSSSEWLTTLDSLWTDGYLDTIKLIATAKVLDETFAYRDLSAISEGLGQQIMSPEAFAFTACDNMNTFSQVLGGIYVDEMLGDKAKERLSSLTQNLIDTYKDLVANTSWMSDGSKKLVSEKLDHMALNILEPVTGYYDYSGLELKTTEEGGTLLSNYLTLKKYREDIESKMIGQPASPTSPWNMISPSTLNAFYDPSSNSINILPGFVTTLMYTDEMSDLELLAGIGFTIGHEISHGFDYMGSQLDAYGKPVKVFTDEDAKTFVEKSKALAAYYDTIEILPDLKVDGTNVLTEAAADLSGLQATLELAGKTEGADYTQFFSYLASKWAQCQPKGYVLQNSTDNHPMNNLRINVNAQMFEPFYEAYGVQEGDTMYLAPEARIHIWG